MTDAPPPACAECCVAMGPVPGFVLTAPPVEGQPVDAAPAPVRFCSLVCLAVFAVKSHNMGAALEQQMVLERARLARLN